MSKNKWFLSSAIQLKVTFENKRNKRGIFRKFAQQKK